VTADELLAALSTLGWKRTDLKRRLGVHANTVTFWCHGRRSVPGYVEAYVGLALHVQRIERLAKEVL
jgi:hypothetical protein